MVANKEESAELIFPSR